MELVMRTKFGSHLYGTSTPASDQDYKSIWVPDGRAILLGRVTNVISDQREKGFAEKNYAGEIEEERFMLQRYLELLCQGQTVALDMLFATDQAMTDDPSWIWGEIGDNKERLITKKSAAFLSYCRQQANKYGIKGSRVAAARKAMDFLSEMYKAESVAKLEQVSSGIYILCASHEHMAVVTQTNAAGTPELFWEVCNRKMPFKASIKNAKDLMEKVFDEYGKRALMAENQEGVDWKALSHAVRVGREAIEVLGTGKITFPLPYKDRILEIKLGKVPYKEVAAEIEELLVDVEAAALKSELREEPDLNWVDKFVCDIYRDAVMEVR